MSRLRPALAAPLFFALALLLAAAAPARAQQGGTASSFPLLTMDASARAAGMAGAFNAVLDGDAGALFYHPALPSAASHNALSVNYLNHLSDLNGGFLSYSRQIDSLGTASAGLRFFGYGTFDGRDAGGNETGDFGSTQVALTAGFARGALGGRVRYGANVHVVYGSIEAARATALAADLGVLYHLPGQDLTLSAAVKNLGGALDSYYRAGSTDLPADVQLGLSKKLAYLPLRLSVTGVNLQDPGQGPEGTGTFDDVMRHLALGAELAPVDVLALRLGYGHRRHEELKTGDQRVDTAGLSAGFGLTIRQFSVDYAFNSWSEIGGLHQFGLRARL